MTHPSPSANFDVTVRRPHWLVRAGAGLTFSLWIGTLALVQWNFDWCFDHGRLRVWGPVMIVSSLAFASLMLVQLLSKRREPFRVTVGPTGLHRGRALLLRRHSIRNASVSLAADGSAVAVLRTRFRDHSFGLGSLFEAEALVEALGLRGQANPFARGLPRRIRMLWAAVPGISTVFLSHHFYGLGVLLLLGLAPLAFRWSRTIIVGADGVWVAAWFRRGRFVPFGRIVAVEQKGIHLILQLAGGERLSVAIEDTYDVQSKRSGAEILADTVRHAIECWRAGAATRPAPVGIAPVSEGLMPHYRVPSIPREHLLEVAEDTAAEVPIRVAAIEALAVHEDDDTRERLDHVADRTASPELRRAASRQRET